MQQPRLSFATMRSGRNVTGRVTADSTTAVLRFSERPRTRYLVLWLTRLPEADRGFQGQVAEVTVRS